MEHDKQPEVWLTHKVLRDAIPPLEIGKYYLVVSYAKCFAAEASSVMETRIAEMPEKEAWREIEAFSVTLGLNDVMRYLTNESYIWSEEVWDINELRLTGMGNPRIDNILRSDSVNFRPFAFRDYLRSYFAQHPDDDPENLNDLRPTNREIQYPTILLRQHKRQPALLDGSHRLVELMLRGETTITTFVGRGDNNARTRLGPSIFRTLRLAYEHSGNDAIIATVKDLIGQSTDGSKWVQIYWIDHVQDEKIRQQGRGLLGQ